MEIDKNGKVSTAEWMTFIEEEIAFTELLETFYSGFTRRLL